MTATTWAINYNRKVRNREFIRVAKDKPCTDCGIKYPTYVMQFDHVRGEKKLSIGLAVNQGYSLTSLIREVAKCDVVCSNCHHLRTYARGQHYGV